jgi:hypothetical protein
MRRHVKDWLRQNATNTDNRLDLNSTVQECFAPTTEAKQEVDILVVHPESMAFFYE